MLADDDRYEAINSGIWSLLALPDCLIDYCISSLISLLLSLPPDEWPIDSLIDYFINPDPDAINYYLIDYLIAPLYWEYF